YPPGSFGDTLPNDPAYVRIRVQPLIRIGDVVYDSIPVSLTLTTWDKSGQTSIQEQVLSPGTNELLLQASAAKYQLRLTKWGTIDEMTLMRNQVQEGALYSLGGNAQAKKLREVLTYRMSNGSYVPETKTEYIYGAGGKVSQILHYLKDANQMPYVSMTDKYTYTMQKVQTAHRYNHKNELIESTTYSYNNDGKLRQGILTSQDRGIVMDVNYSALDGQTGISGRYMINADYRYTHYTHTTNYKMSMQGGNMYQTRIASSNGAIEEGQLQYDFNINPYIHLDLPDIYFVNPSKHNLIGQQKTYQVLFPASEPYSFSYTYDNEGYPTELITKYKSYFTQEHTSTVKTIYRY
ncbi:MAG TPA: hypothetical protein VEZ55_06530, partial [Chitinophagaceae bacterium]|nr:hypothetical protein [Chitinophagaceae bacterium]